MCKSTQCFKFLHCVDIFCSQVHTSYMYVTQNHTHPHHHICGVPHCPFYCPFYKEIPCRGALYLLKFTYGVHCSTVARIPQPIINMSTPSYLRCKLRTYCSPLLFPLLLHFLGISDLICTPFSTEDILVTITANRGHIVPFYKSSVYPIDTHTFSPEVMVRSKHMDPMIFIITYSSKIWNSEHILQHQTIRLMLYEWIIYRGYPPP